jgi:hypothetical protein
MPKPAQPERRRYIRLDSVFPIEIYLHGRQPEKGHKLIQGFTRDVSLGGLCLSVNDPDERLLARLAAGAEPFDITVNLPLGNVVHARVRVAWHEIRQLARHRQLLAGVSYTQISEEGRQSIIDAARRLKYLPRAGAVAAAILAVLLAISSYQSHELRAKNEDLIRRFHEARIEDEAIRASAARVSEKFDALTKTIAGKRSSREAVITKLASLKAEDPQTLAAQRARLEADAEALTKEIASLDDSLKGISDRRSRAGALVEEVGRRRKELEKATVLNMLQWLRTHRNRFTGLVMSYEGDPSIRDWAFTYDQSLVAQAFAISGDERNAAEILRFFRDKAARRGGAFINAYNARTGTPAEETVHVGPNTWIALSAAQYTERTGDRQFLDLAEGIASWVMSQKDREGGLRGGPGLAWYSTEHNLDAYALFKILHSITGKDPYRREMESTLKWIRENTYSRQEKRMNRGKGDSTIATDTLAWAIAAIGPATLAKEGMDPDAIMRFAEEHCLVTTAFARPGRQVVTVKGFDFAKSANVARSGIVSTEWTAQMIISYRMMADFYAQQKDKDRARGYDDKAAFYLGELDKMVISSPSPSGQGAGCLPYASQPSADTGHGWRTPAGAETGSVSGTAYTIFAKKGYNPLGTE